jgi:DNA-binding CsgD family transcriptional regulator
MTNRGNHLTGLLHLRPESQQPKRRRTKAPAKAKSARAGARSHATSSISLLDRIAHAEGSSKGQMVVLRGTLSNPGRDLGRLLARRPTVGHVPPAQQPTPRPQRQLRASSELISQMVAEYRAGATTYQLADRHGLNRNTVAKHLRAAGLRLRVDGLTPDQAVEACRLYETGLSLAAVGERFGVTANPIAAALQQAGVNRRAIRW